MVLISTEKPRRSFLFAVDMSVHVRNFPSTHPCMDFFIREPPFHTPVYDVYRPVFPAPLLAYRLWISLLPDVFYDIVNGVFGINVGRHILFNFPDGVDNGCMILAAEHLPDFG